MLIKILSQKEIQLGKDVYSILDFKLKANPKYHNMLYDLFYQANKKSFALQLLYAYKGVYK